MSDLLTRVQTLNSNWSLTPNSLHCTVQFLKYVPVASIIGWRIQEPGWCSWLSAGLLLQCVQQPNSSIFWDHSYCMHCFIVMSWLKACLHGTSPCLCPLKLIINVYHCAKDDGPSDGQLVTVILTGTEMIHVNGPLRPGFSGFYELNGKPRNMKSLYLFGWRISQNQEDYRMTSPSSWSLAFSKCVINELRAHLHQVSPSTLLWC